MVPKRSPDGGLCSSVMTLPSNDRSFAEPDDTHGSTQFSSWTIISDEHARHEGYTTDATYGILHTRVSILGVVNPVGHQRQSRSHTAHSYFHISHSDYYCPPSPLSLPSFDVDTKPMPGTRATDRTALPWSSSVRTIAPARHMRTRYPTWFWCSSCRPVDPVTMSPLGSPSTHTPFSWPSRTCRHAPEATSHTRAVPSHEPDMRWPSTGRAHVTDRE